MEVQIAFTGAPQDFVAPVSTAYLLEVWGAQGGGSGGMGGYARGSIPLTAGEVLHVYVGGRGSLGGTTALAVGGAGGWNGGGAGGDLLGSRWSSGSGGGGASDVRMGGVSLADRIIVAGGGGGGFEGGAGGGVTGDDGASSWCSQFGCGSNFDQHSTTFWTSGFFSNGGRGGTQSAGGIGGTGANDGGTSGTGGALGVGGRGGSAGNFTSGGGGGGGGYFGGGGGAGGGFMSGSTGRGGGGSGHVGGFLADAAQQSGVRVGDGLVRISYTEPAIDLALELGGGAAVNLRSAGVLPVSVLTTEDFDALSLDVATLRLGPGGAMEAHATGHPEDVDGDGDADVVLHFRTSELGLVCASTELTLTGKTQAGESVRGTSAVLTRSC